MPDKEINQRDENGRMQGYWHNDSRRSKGYYFKGHFVNGIPYGYYERCLLTPNEKLYYAI